MACNWVESLVLIHNCTGAPVILTWVRHWIHLQAVYRKSLYPLYLTELDSDYKIRLLRITLPSRAKCPAAFIELLQPRLSHQSG